MQLTTINSRWTLLLPDHRAIRPEWTAWEVTRLDSMSKNIGPDDVIYDVGSEEGDLSGLMQMWIGEGSGGIYLFEPNEKVWSNIKAIWDANCFPQPLGFWPGFVGEEGKAEKVVGISRWPSWADGPLVAAHGFCQYGEVDLPTITLDNYLAICKRPPTIITIDVEGAELMVLQGARDVLKTHKPLVYCSIHPDVMIETYHYVPNNLHQYMGDLGYRSKFLGEDHESHYVYFHPSGKELTF